MNGTPSLHPLNVLIIGSGMYVCGRGTAGHGTILPAIMQAFDQKMVETVRVATAHQSSFLCFDEKVQDLKKLLGVDFRYSACADDSSHTPAAYATAIKELGDPGAVIIATPDDLHYAMAAKAIEAGRHVLVVKPLAPTVCQVLELAEMARRAGVYAAVEYHKRWDSANVKLRDTFRSGLLGQPLYFRVEYSQPKSIPTVTFRSWVKGTTVFQYLGVHYADIIYFITGDRPSRLVALGQRQVLPIMGIDNFDSMAVLVEWTTGFASLFSTNWISSEKDYAFSRQLIEFVGTKGRYESDQTDRGVRLVTDVLGYQAINPYFCQLYGEASGFARYKGYGIESINAFLQDVWDICNGRQDVLALEGKRPTFGDALVSTAVVEGANLSAHNNGRWVSFDNALVPHLD